MDQTIEKSTRNFLPNELSLNGWNDLKPYLEDLKNREINSIHDFKQWLIDRSEISAFTEEDLGWRYIKMSCDTGNVDHAKSYEMFITEINPHLEEYDDIFNRKILESPFLDQLEHDPYHLLIRTVKQLAQIYRKENIPISVEIKKLEQKYATITSGITIDHNGKEITVQEAENYLKQNNRQLREDIFLKVKARRAEDRKELDDIFTEMVEKRDQIAKNADFDNFRDYMFAEMGRFDYTPKDCKEFHDAIASEVVGVSRSIDGERKEKLGLGELKPWDMEVDIEGKEPLKPFKNSADLVEKTITCFRQIKPEFAEYISIMNSMKHLDLDSRKGKAPGGYNYPLYEVGVPFIFMNSVGSHRDLVTMVHEGGHAIHSFLTRDIELVDFKQLTSEIAELASMSMELISMEHWEVFFPNREDLIRAKKKHLQKVLKTLPWVATVDQFQHWIYENPDHTSEERTENWRRIEARFGSDVIDWTGHEDALDFSWQRQLHLYEVPFYYVEYGMAQLGAIAVWKNYKENPEKAIAQYESALKLGYTKTIPEVYEAAGIKFDFSKEYVRELTSFVRSELDNLN